MAITITVASAEVDANLTDFVVGVDLSNMPASFWSNVDENGTEIRFGSQWRLSGGRSLGGFRRVSDFSSTAVGGS